MKARNAPTSAFIPLQRRLPMKRYRLPHVSKSKRPHTRQRTDRRGRETEPSDWHSQNQASRRAFPDRKHNYPGFHFSKLKYLQNELPPFFLPNWSFHFGMAWGVKRAPGESGHAAGVTRSGYGALLGAMDARCNQSDRCNQSATGPH